MIKYCRTSRFHRYLIQGPFVYLLQSLNTGINLCLLALNNDRYLYVMALMNFTPGGENEVGPGSCTRRVGVRYERPLLTRLSDRQHLSRVPGSAKEVKPSQDPLPISATARQLLQRPGREVKPSQDPLPISATARQLLQRPGRNPAARRGP